MGEFSWFEYAISVHPHHTDYAGVVWHGTYIAWMEEARVEYMKTQNLPYEEWLKAGVELPVVDLALRYRQPLMLGDEALVKVRLDPARGVRLLWHYDIQNQNTQESCVVGTVTLATVDFKNRRVLRRLPEHLQAALDGL
jgi:acyl-CoA thioester hydrolase